MDETVFCSLRAICQLQTHHLISHLRHLMRRQPTAKKIIQGVFDAHICVHAYYGMLVFECELKSLVRCPGPCAERERARNEAQAASIVPTVYSTYVSKTPNRAQSHGRIAEQATMTS
jgi:hypothetical protein